MGVFLVGANPIHLLITLAIVSLGYFLGPVYDFYFCMRLLLRLKWLFLSILLIYIILTPGRSLLAATGAYITVEGVKQGLLRISSLAVLIAAVNLLIRPSGQDELVFAIIWLLSPLRWLGMSVDRLAIRMVLTLNYVHEFQNLLVKEKMSSRELAEVQVANHIEPTAKAGQWGVTQRLTALADKAVNTFAVVIERTSTAACEEILPPQQMLPNHSQWLYPLILGLIYTLT